MFSKLKISLLMAGSLLIAGCETYNLEAPKNNLAQKRQAELINRSEVIAVVGSVDIATDLEQQAAHWGYDLKRKEVLEGLDLYLLTFDCPPGIDPHVASAELERLQPLSTVEANHKYTLQSDLKTASFASQFTARKYANALIEWPEGGCESLLNIGIIDGKIDVATLNAHSSANIEIHPFISGLEDIKAQQHGTAVAEVLVGNGRLKNVKLFNASVVGTDEKGNQYSGVKPMLKALNWMVQSDVQVVNISLAGPYNKTLDRGIQRATDKGLIIVAAVGNRGPESAPLYPAALDDVIATTAVDSQGQIYAKAVRGDHVDVAAPGVDIFVGDEQNARYVSGTSMAAPFIVAKIASDMRYSEAKSVDDVKALLASETQDLGISGPDSVYGAGLIKANRSCYQ